MKLKILSAIIIVGGLLVSAYGLNKTFGTKEETNAEAENNDSQLLNPDDIKEDDTPFNDGNTPEALEAAGLQPTLSTYVSETLESLDKKATGEGAGLDEGYDIYLKSKVFSNIVYYDKNEYISKKDIENLNSLGAFSYFGHL
ncbi:hypothetical protein [Bacillus massiliglaciei]|uniref:hypothetical protein n=1 Tax=Bacillus massiliglaciei TaxID=1816693 RepID=UPI000DA61CD8|nr:hypothetical protein [Bacillus massiliglaciei]